MGMVREKEEVQAVGMGSREGREKVVEVGGLEVGDVGVKNDFYLI